MKRSCYTQSIQMSCYTLDMQTHLYREHAKELHLIEYTEEMSPCKEQSHIEQAFLRCQTECTKELSHTEFEKVQSHTDHTEQLLYFDMQKWWLCCFSLSFTVLVCLCLYWEWLPRWPSG